MTKPIETHLLESRFFKAAKSSSHSAHISSFEHYEELYRQSIEQPDKFWAQQAEELLVWHAKWKAVLEWNEPFAKWFVGGKLNVAKNCLDRHLHSGRRNKAALIWEGEPGDKKTLIAVSCRQ